MHVRKWASLALLLVLASTEVLIGQSPEHRASSSMNPLDRCISIARQSYLNYSEKFFSSGVGGGLHLTHIWSLRWLEARTRQSKDAAERVAAATEHLIRMRDVHKRVQELVASGNAYEGSGPAAAFYVAEAEGRVYQMKGASGEQAARQTARRRAEAARHAFEVNYRDSRLKVEENTGTHYIVANATILEALAWSQMCAEAEMAAVTTNAEQLAAAKSYLKRVTKLAEIARQAPGAQSGTVPRPEVAYYLADAEALVRSKSVGDNDRYVKAVQARLAAARAAYKERWDQYQKGPGSFEALYSWSMTWRSAALGFVMTEADRVSANKAHLVRMKELRKLIDEKYDGRLRDGMDASEFYVAEAQILLSEAEAEARKIKRTRQTT